MICSSHASFNSKLVRLKEGTLQWYESVPLWFQFQTGSIKSLSSRWNASSCAKRFNSKLVRLKVPWSSQTNKQKTEFQFQTGSIKRHHHAHPLQLSTPFQFQTGSIKRVSCRRLRHLACIRFNSKLVRLKVASFAIFLLGFKNRFNSKLVRLKVFFGRNITSCISSFNSKLVRLKAAWMR